MVNTLIKEVLHDQSKALANARDECIELYGNGTLYDATKPFYNKTIQSFMCPSYWDGILCWPETPPNTTLIQNCPSYVHGFLSTNNATRKCMDDGVWFVDKNQNTTWTNYTKCFKDTTTTIFVDIQGSRISHLLENYFPLVKIMTQTGYMISLVSLIVAFAIMLMIKKLHCARNILHMHLFASFIFRAFIFFLKDLIFIDGLGLPSDFDYKNGSMYFNINLETNNWNCKLLTSLWQYFITANYSWILMEGLYLHNLIFRALFVDSNKNIVKYVVIGWGLPLAIVIPWILVRILFEDTFCWTTHDDYRFFLIIAIPTMASNLFNFLMFLRISIVLYSKLRSPINEENRRYKKWAKSTLVLVPLFGVHYAIFLSLYYSMKTNKTIELLWLFCDRLFSSFEGFFVAILYCFLNGEVKAELKPHFHAFAVGLATNRFTRYCFPCREKYLRSAVGRTSVCTTMSCSSLYMNGMWHRNGRSRWDLFAKNKQEKCQNPLKTLDVGSRRSSRSLNKSSHIYHRYSQPNNFIGHVNETALCIEHKSNNSTRSEPFMNEERYAMMSSNNL